MNQPPSKLEQVRIDKVARLLELGVDPWGARFDDREPIHSLREKVPAEDAPPLKVRTAGRILSIRDTGKVFFIDLADRAEAEGDRNEANDDRNDRIQLFIGKKQVGDENWEIVKLLDLWDLIGVEGTLGRTRTGEITIFAEKVTILTKTIAHPPEKFHGAQDIELRLRRRYVDMIQDRQVLARFRRRGQIIQQMRAIMHERGFLEVETPTMQAIAGGAAARPFITHHNALDLSLYMRIAPELYLKRLLVGGMEKVFEIGRVWRNEGIDASHNPEFTLFEAYQAYGDYRTMMDLTKDLITRLVETVSPDRKLTWGQKTFDFSSWASSTYSDLFKDYIGVSMDDEEAVIAEAKRRGLEPAKKHPDVVVSELFEAFVEDHLDGPIFVLDYPASICPLTKRKKDNPRVAERFELYVDGTELANAYTELNDPLLQEELFTRQLAGQKEEDSMAKMDHEFLLALRHGMPPAGGLGIGVDRLIMLLTNSRTIRDVILVPLMRPERPEDFAAKDADDE